MVVNPDSFRYGNARLRLENATGNYRMLRVFDPHNTGKGSFQDADYPDAHMANSESTFTWSYSGDNDAAVFNPYCAVALVEDGFDPAGDFFDSGGSLKSGVICWVELGNHADFASDGVQSLTFGDGTTNNPSISKVGTFRVIISMGNNQTNCRRMSDATGSSDYHYDSDKNNVRGSTADVTQATTEITSWAGRAADVQSITSDISNQGYTDTPTISIDLIGGTDSIVNPKNVKLQPKTSGASKGPLSVTIDSNGEATSSSYNVDSTWEENITNLDIQAGVNNVFGDSVTPENEKPDIATLGITIHGLTDSQLSWLLFDTDVPTGYTSSETVSGDIVDGGMTHAQVVTNPSSNSGYQIAYGVDIDTTTYHSSNGVGSGLYNRGEIFDVRFTFTDKFGQLITPSNTTTLKGQDSSNADQFSSTDTTSPYRLSGSIPDSATATYDTVGEQYHLAVDFAHYGANDPSITYSNNLFKVSRKFLIGDSAANAIANNLGTLPDQTVYNRGETATIEVYIAFARGEALASSNAACTGYNSSNSSDTSDTFASTDANGKATFELPYSSGDLASNDLTGDPKYLKVTKEGNTSDASNTDWALSRKWVLDTSGAASIDPANADNGCFTSKSANPTTDAHTTFNRGQTVNFATHVYNVRGEKLGSSLVYWNIRPTGSETFDESSQSFTLSSGKIDTSYDVDTDEGTGGKTLVVASSSISGTRQARTGLSGHGNFAETDTTTAEWTVSDQYQLEVRLQKEATRNTDPEDTQFTIGEDAIYTYGQVLDQEGDLVSGVTVNFVLKDPQDVSHETKTGTTNSDGWTDAKPLQTRAPKGSGWTMSGTTDSHNGNTASNDQTLAMVSAFTANKNAIVFLEPVNSIANSNDNVSPDNTSIPRPGDLILVGFAYLVDGVRTAPDTGYTPRFMLGYYDESSSKVKILQSDGTWKTKDDAGYSEHFFNSTFNNETDASGNALNYLTAFGTSSQLTSAGISGNEMDTSTWPKGQLVVTVQFEYDTQRFLDDERFLFGIKTVDTQAIYQHQLFGLDAVPWRSDPDISPIIAERVSAIQGIWPSDVSIDYTTQGNINKVTYTVNDLNITDFPNSIQTIVEVTARDSQNRPTTIDYTLRQDDGTTLTVQKTVTWNTDGTISAISTVEV